MYIYNIAIRWANGDLEGFGASGLTHNSAFERALGKANRKSIDIGKPFDILSSTEYQDLEPEMQDELQADWDGSDL